MAKLSEIAYGTRILIPCARCGTKRSLKFKGPGHYARAKEKICLACRVEDQAENQNLSGSRQHRKMNMPDMKEAA